MGKRTLAMVVYDPAAQQRAVKQARPSPAAGSVVPYDVEPIDAVPVNSVAPRPRSRRAPLPPAPAMPEEPRYLREHILPALGLREDLPVHFIDRKRVTDTDVDAHQNRFRVPSDGVRHHLRSILTPEELEHANLLHDPVPRPRKKKHGSEPQLEDVSAADNNEDDEQGKKIRKKTQGRKHGGLPVRLVDVAAGASSELLLSRWESSGGTIVKGGRYMDFVRRCSFKEKDVVDIWAFKQRAFRLLGNTIYHESPLHLLIVKRDLNGAE